jgi:hypothetical protein
LLLIPASFGLEIQNYVGFKGSNKQTRKTCSCESHRGPLCWPLAPSVPTPLAVCPRLARKHAPQCHAADQPSHRHTRAPHLRATECAAQGHTIFFLSVWLSKVWLVTPCLSDLQPRGVAGAPPCPRAGGGRCAVSKVSETSRVCHPDLSGTPCSAVGRCLLHSISIRFARLFCFSTPSPNCPAVEQPLVLCLLPPLVTLFTPRITDARCASTRTWRCLLCHSALSATDGLRRSRNLTPIHSHPHFPFTPRYNFASWRCNGTDQRAVRADGLNIGSYTSSGVALDDRGGLW